MFENLIRVNEERFNYVELPQIYTKSKRAVGNVSFSKSSPRKQLFELPTHQPQYDPNYNIVRTKDPKLVNMNIKKLKEIRIPE